MIINNNNDNNNNNNNNDNGIQSGIFHIVTLHLLEVISASDDRTGHQHWRDSPYLFGEIPHIGLVEAGRLGQ